MHKHSLHSFINLLQFVVLWFDKGAGSDKLPAPRRFYGERTRCASVLLLVLLDDVFADNELAGCASAELLEGEATHQLLIRGRALGARAGQEAEEPADERAHL